MKVPCACQACGFVDEAEWSQIGQWIGCRRCGKTVVVPAPMETIGPAEPPRTVVKFRCPACNRKFATRPELAGKKIRCNGCGAGVRVPESEPDYWSDDDEAPAAAPARARTDAVPSAVPQAARGLAPAPAVTRPTFGGSLPEASPGLDELASIDGMTARRAGTILPSRAETMEQVRQQVAEETAAALEKSEKKAKAQKKKKRKKSGYFDAKETLKLVAGVGVLVGVLALLAWGYPDFRFPLGGILCVVGFIVYLLGVTSLRQLVAEEGAFKALLFRFCPPYQWWYVATRWDEAKDFVAFFGAGLMILSIGSAIIKTSAVGKRAEAADRAYQKVREGTTAEPTPPPPSLNPPRRDRRADGPTAPPNADAGDEE